MLSVEVPGGTIATSCHGPDDGDALLLVNGARTCSAMWEPVLSRLDGFRVVRFDLRGHGQSSPGADDAHHSIERFADDAAAVLDAWEIGSAVVWGMAFGARVALAVADRHPARVRLLALFDASVERADPKAQADGQQRARLARQEAGLSETPGREQWFAHVDGDAARRAIIGAGRNSEPQEPRLARLAATGIPVLLAVGDHDPNEPATRRIAAALPNAEFHLLELTGHGSVVERPGLCADVFLSWCARQDR